jgi:pimeloyl-ACP methyl ester carboxylesterase
METQNKVTDHLKLFMLIAVLVTASALNVKAQKNHDMQSLTSSGYAPVNGLNMYYQIHGKGSMPLVLIHGGGSTIETSFGTLIPLLSPHYKLIAVELQAHGRTNDRDAPESFAQDADDVAALLKYLKVERANILGFSNGGSTAMQIAIRHADVVNKIIVISGAYRRDGFITDFFDGMQHVTLAMMPQGLKTAYLKVAPNKNNLQVMFDKDRLRMVNFTDWPDEDLASIKIPAFFMVADRDVITVEHTIKMSRLTPNGQLAVIPGSHGSFIGEVETARPGSKLPVAVVGLIREFLN